PASTSCIQVSGPTRPSTRRWRRSWNARIAASVEGPNHPASSSGASAYPRAARRCWTSSTSDPWSPSRKTRMPRVCDSTGCPANAAVLRELQVWREVAEDGVLRLGTDDPGNLLPVLEQDERRDRHHAIGACGLRVLVDVELRDLEGLALLVPDLLHDGGNHVTRDAPFRPEVHEDRGIGVENRCLEIRFRDRSDVRHDRSFSFVRGPPAGTAGTDPYALRTLPGRADIPSAVVGLILEEALGVDRCLAPLSGSRHGLAVDPVGHVALREDPGHARRRPGLRDRGVALVVEREFAWA